MKRKQPSPLVRVRYSAAPLASSGSSVQSSNSRKNHSDLQSALVVCPAVLAERKDTPSLRTTSRGSRVAASGAVATQVSRETALADLHNDMNSQSALGSPASLLSSWVRFHQLWFGPEVHPFPLTTFQIYAVGAMLKAGGYRSAPNFLSRAKEEHVVLGFPWSDELRLAARKTSSSITRGIGRPRQSKPLDLAAVWRADIPWRPESNSLPVGGKLLIIAGSFFCTREIELSLALRQYISFDVNIPRVTWHLPCSKTDPRALGKYRSWDCVCENVADEPCAFHALQSHCQLLDDMFKSRQSETPLPLFPDIEGNTSEKEGEVRLIEYSASRLGLDTRSPIGTRLFGGHSLRVSGAQWLARSGVPLALITSLRPLWRPSQMCIKALQPFETYDLYSMTLVDHMKRPNSNWRKWRPCIVRPFCPK